MAEMDLNLQLGYTPHITQPSLEEVSLQQTLWNFPNARKASLCHGLFTSVPSLSRVTTTCEEQGSMVAAFGLLKIVLSYLPPAHERYSETMRKN